MIKPVHKLVSPASAAILCVLLLAASFLLTITTQLGALFGGYYTALLIVNVIGIVLLSGFILAALIRLWREFKERTLGSRLTFRFLMTSILLAALPLIVMYYFAVQFLSKGIDSWFDVRIEQALDDALLLGRSSIEAIKTDLIEEVERHALTLSSVTDQLDIVRLLDELREAGQYSEMSLYSINGGIIASSSADALTLLPDAPDASVWSKVRQGQRFSALEPQPSGLRLRVVIPVYGVRISDALRALQILQPMPIRYSQLGESVQLASAEYDKLQYLRGPLKFSFVLTLGLVSLMTLLMAIWIGIFFARRMFAPLRELAEGTRAVAQGNYETQLPVTSTDELGVLVASFNDMTSQINRVQTQVKTSQRETENQRAYLETVLSHLSSGVLSFDAELNLRTYNNAAEQILNVSFASLKNTSTGHLVDRLEWTEPLLGLVTKLEQSERTELQEEIQVFAASGRKTLICRATKLSQDQGLVLVFDDATELIRAQRDAAWGEVARRLAHEIKNPLTPIALSAERIRHKYLHKLEGDNKETLDRATRTIAQQVDAMKEMVNAFSSYAQPVKMQFTLFDLNQLVRDVVELHRADKTPQKKSVFEFNLTLDDDLPIINADPNRLRQVLNNLIINARDAQGAGEKTSLTIESRHRQAENEIELRFIDAGPGFEPGMIERVFEPYATSKEKGTGLGLAIVRRIVDEHTGLVRVSNVASGGAKVLIRLPVNRASDLVDNVCVGRATGSN